MKSRLVILFIIIFYNLVNAKYKFSSVLAFGDWYKIGITETGIYKIDFNFLKRMGLDPTKINPNKMKIYGNGLGMLPQKIDTNQTDDLTENAIYVSNGNDSTFDVADFVVFYARGPHTWTYNTSQKIYRHTYNIYSDTSYYFITFGGDVGKRIQYANCNASTITGTINTYDAYVFYEKETYNIISSGREWLGEKFESSSQVSVNIPLDNVTLNATGKMVGSFCVKPNNNATTSFSLKSGSTNIGLLPFAGFISQGNDRVASIQESLFDFETSLSSNNVLNVKVIYDKSNDNGAIGYLNFIEINYPANLNYNGKPIHFRNKDAINGIFQYRIESAPNDLQIWHVSDPTNAIKVNSSESDFCYESSKNAPEFVAFSANDPINQPNFVGKVSNQNLHGINKIDFLIISNPLFVDDANRLAQFRNSNGIATQVVTPVQIYNEFSSGAQDISAIRNFANFLYTQKGLKNILLFGGASYDYKNRISNNTNFVPVYESRESFHTVNSYCSDDYYAFFGIGEGEWSENGGDNYSMKIGIGRLPVSNLTESKYVIDKIINYSSKNSFGKWRNKIAFMSDNGDGYLHFNDAERMSNRVDTTFKQFNVSKLHMDAYNLVSTPSGSKVPAMNESIRNLINQGALIINYSGHGGPEQLTQENIIDIQTIRGWKNMNKLPFFVTATCDFGVYDDPSKSSGGELLVLSPNGGGIGVITSGRPVYQFTNYRLNQAFYLSVFEKDSTDKYLTLGEIFKRTKNKSLSGVNNRSYTLLADPSLTLNFPTKSIRVTKINNIPVTDFKDTLKALSLVNIEGEVFETTTNETITNFNGTLYSDIYDKYNLMQTVGQNGADKVTFLSRNNILHAGQASVKSGTFNFSFILPKDINYNYGSGKISLYAYDPTSSTDASGYLATAIIGGSNPNAKVDNIPPDITLYINDTTFKDGGYSKNDPKLLAKLFDENGINLSTAAIGHEISAILSSDPNNPLTLNDYYITTSDTYKSGKVEYDFGTLPEGSYQLKLKAWDTYNNSSEKTIGFIIASSGQVAIQKLMNYPNPFREKTTFSIQHNRAGDDLEVRIQIFNSEGSLIKDFTENISSALGILNIEYEAKVNESYNLTPGLYVYKCTLSSKSINSQTEQLQKLVLIR
ncbi:MAG: type IX secretion system sortase PorU [Bacteroidota bacterium]|nr:type IX secretion system sortase PorU [Bacteroidota bacterium]